MTRTDAQAPDRSLDAKSTTAVAWAGIVAVWFVAARGFAPFELLYLPSGGALDMDPGAETLRRSGWAIARLAFVASSPVAASAMLGELLLGRLSVASRGVERVGLAYLLGSGAASLLILALRALDVPVTPLGLAAAALLALPFALRGARRAPPPAPTATRSRAATLVDASSVGLVGVLLASALAPEVAWDALEYHLPIARAWAEGPIRSLPGVFDAELRTGVDLLFIPALAAAEPDAAAVVSAAFALALAALVRAEATRALSPLTGAWCGLLVLSSPILLTLAPTCYTDLAVGAYGFGALLAAHRWNRGEGRAFATLAVVFAAYAANAKLHAAVLLPAVFVLLVVGGRPPGLARLARLTGLAALLVGPWFLKSALLTGNPFFPVLGGLFGFGAFDSAHVSLRADRLAGDLPAALRTFPAYAAELAFGRHPFLGGLLGPLPFAFAPFALRRVGRATATLIAVWLVLFALQMLFMPSLRFGLPLWSFFALVTAHGACRVARWGRWQASATAAICAFAAVFQSASAIAAYAPRMAAIGAPHAYERAVWPAQAALRDMVGDSEAVVAIPMGAVLWMPKPVYLLIGERNGEIFAGRDPAPHVFEVFERRGVRSMVLPMPLDSVAEGRYDHPIFGDWIRAGWLRPRDDIEMRPESTYRIWVAMDVVPPKLFREMRGGEHKEAHGGRAR